ncbi:IS3 family transposase [Hoyosella sp. YIM 151337]|uniref:IS3 family transposase n=1 Tax=Hoyosella sp. YIM 151337 TaxID=2992742 RepID=UPI00223651DB|nr:IS3 family transposase [Hoyosella sp. YIM 151337]MCW4352593.1 IS3 family transposase [Hoyosella sp. YIM 151337]
MPAPRKYPQELRERAMRLVQEAREQDPDLSLNAAVIRIGQRTGVNADTLRGWVKQADIDAGRRPGVTTSDAARIKELEAENRELKRANEILLAASSFFRAGARPATALVVQFIDDHRHRFGVEPICRVLTEHGVKIAPSGYYAFKTRPASARAIRDEELIVEIERVFWDRRLGRGISGARKMWHLLKREGIVVARCTVERLMRRQGLRGVLRGRQFVTTKPDDASFRAPDHVQRCFQADRPNELWVVDFTYVPTWSGMAFTAFVTDVYSRRIVGWRTMNRMPTELPLDALEMALWVRDRAGQDVTGVIQHSDAGAQYTAIRYAERLADVGAIASIGTVGDSYDNALAETVVGLYKTECVKIDGPFRTVDELELATLSWVHWFNENRLHSSIGYLTPTEKENEYYRENTSQYQPALGEPALH